MPVLSSQESKFLYFRGQAEQDCRMSRDLGQTEYTPLKESDSLAICRKTKTTDKYVNDRQITYTTYLSEI